MCVYEGASGSYGKTEGLGGGEMRSRFSYTDGLILELSVLNEVIYI